MDAVIGCRGMAEADTSVRRYEKAGRLIREAERVPKASKLYGEMIENRLEQLFDSPSLTPRPPARPRL